MTSDDAYHRCHHCGLEMLPWWNIEEPVPHSDDPPQQFHPKCFAKWLKALVEGRPQ